MVRSVIIGVMTNANLVISRQEHANRVLSNTTAYRSVMPYAVSIVYKLAVAERAVSQLGIVSTVVRPGSMVTNVPILVASVHLDRLAIQ